MTPIKIIGIGSPFGADRLGWDVILELQKLANEAWLKDIILAACDRPGPQLLEEMRGTNHVILVDAVQAGLIPGRIARWTSADIIAPTAPISTHGYGVAHTLALGHTLNMLPPHLVLIGLEVGEKTELAPSPEILERLVMAVKIQIGDFRAAPDAQV